MAEESFKLLALPVDVAVDLLWAGDFLLLGVSSEFVRAADIRALVHSNRDSLLCVALHR